MKAQPVNQAQISKADRQKGAEVGTRSFLPQPAVMHPILQLQQQIGNQAVGRLIQARLTVGEANDTYEQEADRVAAAVVSQIHAPKTPSAGQNISVQRQVTGNDEEELQTKPLIQCKSDVGGMAVSSEIEASIQQARGGGQPLAESIRTPMEQAFGTDFSGVRVHTNAQSHQLNQSIQAKAFTTGQDIFFRQGEYSPGSRGGQELLAHELTHVVQQNRSKIQKTQLSGDKPRRMSLSPLTILTQGELQRKLIIGGEVIRPYGKNGQALWTEVKNYGLSIGMSFRGTRKKLFIDQFCKSPLEHKYTDLQAFSVDFLKVAEEKGLSKEINTFSRPAWPKDYKQLLHFKPGDNIRHVIRNATIKNALQDELEFVEMIAEGNEEQVKEYFACMANKLKVLVPEQAAPTVMIKEIYKKLYLNLVNLYAGVGGDNQLIGFAADDVERLGKELLKDGPRPIKIQAVFLTVWEKIESAFKKVKGNATKGGTINPLRQLMDTIFQFLTGRIKDWQGSTKTDFAPAANLAQDVIDIGQNFGFDLMIPHQGTAEEATVAERQKQLIFVETALRNYAPGTHELTQIFEVFLGVNAPVNQNPINPINQNNGMDQT
jgi:hypothetical protein